MNIQDFNTFQTAWSQAHEIMAAGKVFQKDTLELIFDGLAKYPLQSVLTALNYHCNTAKYAPVPADITEILDIKEKHISADEAWAMMPDDESVTVVWTREMSEAYSIAYKLIKYGDQVAVRMAFKASYTRLCDESKLVDRVPVWSACLGYDKAKIEPELMKAVSAGRITKETAVKLLPAPTYEGPIAGLLNGTVTELPTNDENLKKRWSEIKTAIQHGQEKLAEKEKKRITDASEKRFELESKKQETLKKVDAILGKD